MHRPVSRTKDYIDLLKSRIALSTKVKMRPQPEALRVAAAPSVNVPLTTVSRDGNFDAYLSISFPGANGVLTEPLLVDSGNTSLIVADYTAIAALPGFSQNYKVLDYDIEEPWGCPACKLRGPIKIPLGQGHFHDIPDCIFYACTGPNSENERTKNFGIGCLSPRRIGVSDLQSPLALSIDYPYAELDYAPSVQIFEPGAGYIIVGNSFLNLYKDVPASYQMFDILKDQLWMSLRPKSLVVANTLTEWPGELAGSSIAMIDTGGGPAFLSDPKEYVWAKDWPSPAPLPSWVGGSYCCQATSSDLTITLNDAKNRQFSYQVSASKLPPSTHGLTLVMCKICSSMQTGRDEKPQDGMNIGGLSALFNYILIDYAQAQSRI